MSKSRTTKLSSDEVLEAIVYPVPDVKTLSLASRVLPLRLIYKYLSQRQDSNKRVGY